MEDIIYKVHHPASFDSDLHH